MSLFHIFLEWLLEKVHELYSASMFAHVFLLHWGFSVIFYLPSSSHH